MTALLEYKSSSFKLGCVILVMELPALGSCLPPNGSLLYKCCSSVTVPYTVMTANAKLSMPHFLLNQMFKNCGIHSMCSKTTTDYVTI